MKASKNVLYFCAWALFFPGLALADITSITLRLGGGCNLTNATESCTIKAVASGSNLGSEQVRLQKSTTGRTGAGGRFRNLGRPRTLSDTGRAQWKFKNDPGVNVCYRVRDTASRVRSRERCLGTDSSSSSSSASSISSSSSANSSASSSSASSSASASSVSSSSAGSSSSVPTYTRGQALFSAQCAGCHSANSLRGSTAAKLRAANMPPGNSITDSGQLSDLAAYLGSV